MRTITIEKAAEALRKLLKNHGADGFEDAKTAYLKSVVVVDDNGDPADLDVIVETVEKTAPADTSAVIEKAVTKAVESAIAAMQPAADTKVKAIDKAPAVIRKFGAVRNFKGDGAEEKAYRFGVWVAACAGKRWAQKRASSLGINIEKSFADDIEAKEHAEYDNTIGGFLVPEEFNADLIDLRETYGVFRRNANVVPMSRDVIRRPSKTSDLTAYFVGETAAGTESTAAFGGSVLTAKKLMVLTTASSELVEDAAVNVGDWVAGNIAYRFAEKEDQCGFNGDGTSTYGGIVGVIQRLSDLNGTDEGGGLIQATGDLYSEITLADIAKLVGLAPTYNRMNKFYCSQAVWGGAMLRLASAAGGSTFIDVQTGRMQYQFLGFPVEIVQVMPKTAAVSQIALLFGDLALAADFGDRRQTSISVSDSALNAFEQDEIAIRGTERFDIAAHSLGSATEAGPIVGLITKDS